jgi:hypothetical protein
VGQGTTTLFMPSVCQYSTEPNQHFLAHAEISDKGLKFYDYLQMILFRPNQFKQVHLIQITLNESDESLKAMAAEGNMKASKKCCY